MIDVDKRLTADARDAADRGAPAVDQDQGIEIVQLNLGASRRILIGVVGVAIARVSPPLEGGYGLAQYIQHISAHAGLGDFLCVDHRYGCGDFVRGGRYPRPRDDDFQGFAFTRLGTRVSGGLFLSSLCERRVSADHTQ